MKSVESLAAKKPTDDCNRARVDAAFDEVFASARFAKLNDNQKHLTTLFYIAHTENRPIGTPEMKGHVFSSTQTSNNNIYYSYLSVTRSVLSEFGIKITKTAAHQSGKPANFEVRLKKPSPDTILHSDEPLERKKPLPKELQEGIYREAEYRLTRVLVSTLYSDLVYGNKPHSPEHDPLLLIRQTIPSEHIAILQGNKSDEKFRTYLIHMALKGINTRIESLKNRHTPSPRETQTATLLIGAAQKGKNHKQILKDVYTFLTTPPQPPPEG